MKHLMSVTAIGALLIATGCEPAQPWNGQTFAQGTPTTPNYQPSNYSGPASDNPLTGSTNTALEQGLINILIGQLGVNSEQAMGGVGSIFALAQQRMNPGDFMQLSSAVPGMDRYLSSVPRPKSSNVWLGSASDLLGENNNLGSLAALMGSFQTLGMNAKMISQFVPVVLNYVQDQSGPAAMSLLHSALY